MILGILVRKELLHLAIAPSSYLTLAIFVIALLALANGNIITIGQASMQPIFELVPWLSLVLISALAMNSFSSEHQQGTLELLFSKPIPEITIPISKLFAIVLFASQSLIAFVIYGLFLQGFGPLDWGEVAGQLLGSIFIFSTMAALALAVAAGSTNGIVTLIASALINFLMLILGTQVVTQNLPFGIGSLLENIGLQSHYQDLERGVLTSRTIIYAITLIVVAILIANSRLLKMRYPAGHPNMRNNLIQTLFGLIIAVVVTLTGWGLPGYFDLTSRGLYTLSGTTKQVLAELSDKLQVDLYVSSELPAQVQPAIRELKYLLTEISRNNNNIILQQINVNAGDAAQEEAIQQLGLQSTQFSIVDTGGVQLKEGYLGVTFKYKEKTEVIPYIESTDNLEYDVMSLIYQISRGEKPQVSFVEFSEDVPSQSNYTQLVSTLSKQFTVGQLDINSDEEEFVPNKHKALIIAGIPGPLTKDHIAKLHKYLERGGSVLYMANPVNTDVSSGEPIAVANEDFPKDLFKQYGIVINTDLIYDLASNESVNASSGGFSSFVPYPFWSVAKTTDRGASITREIAQLLAPWSSSLTLEGAQLTDVVHTPLFITTDFAGRQTESELNIKLDAELNQENLQSYTLAALASRKLAGDSISQLAVISSTSALSDGFSEYKQNLSFGLRLIEILTQNTGLSEIKAKTRSAAALTVASELHLTLLRFAIPAVSVASIGAIGLLVLMRRRAAQRRVYEIA